MNQNIAIAILAFWAVAATGVMIAALRSRSKAQKDLMAVRVSRDKAIKIAQDFQRVNEELQNAVTTPKPAAPSLARQFLDAAAKPARPRPRPSRSSAPSTDTMNAAVIGSTVYWGGMTDSNNSTSCDTSSTSSSSDSGSCGGGGE